MLETVHLLKVVDKDGEVVAEAPLICKDPQRALEIIDSLIHPGIRMQIDPRTVLRETLRAITGGDGYECVTSYTALLLTEQVQTGEPRFAVDAG